VLDITEHEHQAHYRRVVGDIKAKAETDNEEKGRAEAKNSWLTGTAAWTSSRGRASPPAASTAASSVRFCEAGKKVVTVALGLLIPDETAPFWVTWSTS